MAATLSMLLSILCLIVPNESFTRIDLTGVGKDMGAGKAGAADLVPATVDNSTSGADPAETLLCRRAILDLLLRWQWSGLQVQFGRAVLGCEVSFARNVFQR